MHTEHDKIYGKPLKKIWDMHTKISFLKRKLNMLSKAPVKHKNMFVHMLQTQRYKQDLPARQRIEAQIYLLRHDYIIM